MFSIGRCAMTEDAGDVDESQEWHDFDPDC